LDQEGEDKVVDFYPVFCFLWKDKKNIFLRYLAQSLH
jgi:hypothetical protein